MISNKKRLSLEDAAIYIFCSHVLLVIINKDKYFGLGGSIITYGTYTVIFILGLMKITTLSKKYVFSWTQKISGFLAVYSIATYAVNGGEQDTFFASLLFFACIFAVSSFDFTEKHIDIFIYCYFLSSLILSVILLLQLRNPYGLYGELRYTVYYDSENYYDVNFLSSYISLPTALMFRKIYKRETRHPFLNAGGTMLNIIAVFLTGSRAGLFVTLALVFVEMFYTNKKMSTKKLFAVPAIIIGIIVVFNFLPQNILSHLSQGVLISGTSRRSMDWKIGMALFMQHPIVGNGMYSPIFLVKRYFPNYYWLTAHNTYISYLITHGLIAGIPFIGLIISPAVKLIRFRLQKILDRNNVFFLFFYLAFLMQILVIEGNFSDVVLVPFLLAIITNNFTKLFHDEGCGD